jgi:hypothetical protein
VALVGVGVMGLAFVGELVRLFELFLGDELHKLLVTVGLLGVAGGLTLVSRRGRTRWIGPLWRVDPQELAAWLSEVLASAEVSVR